MPSRSDAADAAPRYGVVGHPVAHSLSPQIHAAFARETGLVVDYQRVPAPLDAFMPTVDRFFAAGGRGLNVTVPFKREAHAACGRLSDRARAAGAVNWLACEAGVLVGDNTDGVGLVRDLERQMQDARHRLDGRVLLVGAGGAARGVLGPLLACRPARLVVANRDAARAAALVDGLVDAHDGRATVASFASLAGQSFDVVVNATSASLADAPLPLPASVFADGALAYDLMYAARPTRFMIDAHAAGAARVVDGLGMLVEQAAESFRLWRGVMPDTAGVVAALRAQLDAGAAP